MKKRMAALVTALLLTAAGTAIAEQRAGALTFSPFAGGYTFDGRQHLLTAPVVGLRLGYDITKNFGVEATGNFASTKGTGTPTTGYYTNQGRAYLYNVRLEGLYNFMSDKKFVPFVSLGAGMSYIQNDQPGLRTNNDATGLIGVGFKYFIVDDVALRADYRQIFSPHAAPAFDVRSHESTKNGYWLNYEYTLGLQFLFGGKKPLVAKVIEPTPEPAPKTEEIEITEPPPAPSPTPTPVPVDGKVGPWSPWSVCSAPCGGGTKIRTRPVLTKPANGGSLPALTERTGCNSQACVEEEKINLLIEFDFNKAVIKKEFFPNADTVGAFMKKDSKMVISLDGWTDSIGPDKYNKTLSQRRADAVKSYLVNKHKIDPDRITAIGHGKSFKYDNKTEAGRYKNRRVEMEQKITVEKSTPAEK